MYIIIYIYISINIDLRILCVYACMYIYIYMYIYTHTDQQLPQVTSRTAPPCCRPLSPRIPSDTTCSKPVPHGPTGYDPVEIPMRAFGVLNGETHKFNILKQYPNHLLL